MSKSHIHQVTPMHKGKSGFFSDEGTENNNNTDLPSTDVVRDAMGGIFEEEETDEDKMYAHELPPDPFMQKLTIDEDEEEEEDDYGDEDFLEESKATVASTNSYQISKSTSIVSPINAKSSPSKKKCASILEDANMKMDTLIDKVSSVTTDGNVQCASSASVPVIATATSPRPLSKGKLIPTSVSPRATSRSPRSISSTNSKRNKSAQKLRQSPIRVQSQEPDTANSSQSSAKAIATSPKKTSMSTEYNDDDFDFDYEDDFGGEIEKESPKKGKNSSFNDTPGKKVAKVTAHTTQEEDDDDELFETFNPLKEVNTEGEESSNLIEGKLEGMTLESYMAEYTKVKELDEGFQMDDDEEKSPPVVDPQGLEGCSPGPGQRHINGTNSPFRIDRREFSQNYDEEYEDDEEHVVEERVDASSQNGEILATILTQMQDVQSKLEVLSTSQNVSPVKSIMKKEVSFTSNSDGKNSKITNKNTSKKSVNHSPIEHRGTAGHVSVADKVASGVKSSLKHHKQDSFSSDDVDNDICHTDHKNPPLEVKVEVLKKQLRKKVDDTKKMEDRMKRMEKEMEDMHNKWKDAEDALAAANKKVNKSNKAKLTAQKKVAEMTQEMIHYESLIEAVEQLRENEALLLGKVSQLEDQNIETSKALKASMSRELEWRALYKKEHAADGQFGNNNNNGAAPRASSGMNSHRSLPDHERAHVRQSKAVYERNSITEGRQKKKKKKTAVPQEGGGNNRQKILPILISKQRK